MAQNPVLDTQRDFSAGELDTQVKRRDDLPIMRAGARQMANWRVLNSGVIQQRPGRRAVFPQTVSGRVDEVLINGITYRLCFGGDGSFVIRDVNGTVSFSQGANSYPWRTATVDQIVWTVVKTGLLSSDVVICFPGLRTQVASFDGVGTWTMGSFVFASGSDGIASAPFFRIAAPGSTMLPSSSGAAGTSVNLTASADVFLPTHLNGYFRFANSRMQITSVTDTKHATAVLLETMYPTQRLTVAARSGAVGTPSSGFIVGQVVEGSSTATEGIIVAVDVPNNFIYVQVLTTLTGFITSDFLVGPTATASITAITNVSPIACQVWDEQIVSDARGWPRSCANDRGRLIFCDLPGVPDGAMWSAVDGPYSFTIGPNPTDAMVEIMSGRPRIYHIAGWYDQIVFTDKGIYSIPIGITTPLVPGSVQFLPITNEAAAQVKPAFVNEGFLYVNAGQNRVNAIFGSGAANSTRPYQVVDISAYHTHLFAGRPKGIAVSTGDGTFPERYAYVINADGTLAVGRFEPGKEWVGWVPWSGQGVPNWVSALHANVMFTTTYAAASQTLAEVLDDDRYLDSSILVNQLADAMKPPALSPLTGPLWWLPNGSVDLMIGARPLGTYRIDNAGKIVPNQSGEDLTSPALVAGLSYQPTLEPFVANAEPGPDRAQRMRPRRITRFKADVENSTGFVMVKFYAGRLGPHLPALGDITGQHRIPVWNQGDDQGAAPPLREGAEEWRPLGRSFDPRVGIIKDVPGPLRIVEIGLEATV